MQAEVLGTGELDDRSHVVQDGSVAVVADPRRDVDRVELYPAGPRADVMAAMNESAVNAAAGGLHGFAPALTSFVGRVAAVDEVGCLLEHHRLVTVIGPGGSGKTRLATEVAGRVADRFADGVWLAELAALRDPEEVPAAVASALGVRELPGLPVADALMRALSQQQMLLVLDNCEHVIGAAAQLCAELLRVAGDLRVLATSREPMRTAGEARYRLAPLALPGPDGPDDPDDPGGECESVALFVDRARQADVRFTLDEKTRPAVARLVRRLDGMPLAIELAAARVEALGVAQLLDRVDDRLYLLTAGDRLAAGRQRSLADTVQWSYQMLTEPEQRVFRRVSVFPGPFTLEAAEAVAGEGAAAGVLRLVDCSLVVPPRTDPDGRSRYVMLETLRAFGTGLLAEAAGQAEAAAGLARYALEVAEGAAAGLQTGSGEVAATRWLNAEEATTRQALAWATEHDPATALRLALALAPWWFLRGRSPGGYRLLREAAERAETAGQAEEGSEAWFTVQYWLGRMALTFADVAISLDHLTALRAGLEDLEPSRALVDCLASRPAALVHLGRGDEAKQDGRRALAMARELGYQLGEARALVTLATVASYQDDLDGAVELARQAERIQVDVPRWSARARTNVLTRALMRSGDLAAAERACAVGLARARDEGDLLYQASALTNMVNLDLRAGRFTDAASHLRESLQLAVKTGALIDLLNGLDCCGHLCAATGRGAEAVTMWAARRALDEGMTEAPADARRRDDALRQVRRGLDARRARSAQDRGAAMSMPAATEYVLLLTEPEPGRPDLPPDLAKLSARERELVTLVAQGYTDAQIAAELYISVRTVSSHLDRIRAKTGCRRRTDLTRLALNTGLV